ncbi:nucleotide pyrophosphohydrolase [Ligilactobacillus aviarius]|uniref:nucleotide pyrophosphohydrolase n=1 Tax=Ligilactobacillus aviarius TaxID=1606 RepID=UPI0024B94B28|nr:nucleotide pyrophosphohydrolase [Ligilactobacillus aviarius]
MDHKKLMQELVDFRHSRGWDEYHNLKNLAESVNIESAEIMEIFQWKETGESLNDEEKTHLKGEIADTLIYLFYMCDRLDVDPVDIMKAKLEYNKGRYWKEDKDA